MEAMLVAVPYMVLFHGRYKQIDAVRRLHAVRILRQRQMTDLNGRFLTVSHCLQGIDDVQQVRTDVRLLRFFEEFLDVVHDFVDESDDIRIRQTLAVRLVEAFNEFLQQNRP